MNFAGIDFSMSCPAITVGNSKDFSKCKTFYYTSDNKFVGSFKHSVYGIMHIPYSCQEERFDNISEWAIAILKKFKVTDVCLEGYSMGSKGNITGIAENAGLLKHKMWKQGIKFSTPAPTQIKKYFSGKGNANKDFMYESFIEQTKIQLCEEIGYNKIPKPDSNPISDIVDSYAMLCYAIDNQM